MGLISMELVLRPARGAAVWLRDTGTLCVCLGYSMFPSHLYRISACGTFLIARSGTHTVKDCRTEQRERWRKIRWEANAKREKEERRATVQRWKERAMMKAEDKDVGPCR